MKDTIRGKGLMLKFFAPKGFKTWEGKCGKFLNHFSGTSFSHFEAGFCNAPFLSCTMPIPTALDCQIWMGVTLGTVVKLGAWVEKLSRFRTWDAKS